ncbi:MAG TPA: T9SS type A sorting domain-containing protein, partial [Hanamia sp.]|nr:T9SS type A sorting domain-containing protein [Hanamia sp.]
GTTATSSPDVLTTGLFYQATGSLSSEGSYRVINNTQQKPEWQVSPDHTGNTDGMMLVVNGQAEKFFQHTVTDSHGFTSGDYTMSLYIMNVDTAGICAPDPLLPIITFQVEYLDETGSWVSLSNSPYTAAAIPQTSSPTWVNIGAKFNLPPTGAFFPTQIRITLGDGTVGGCGNDFAIDDINLSQCPAGDVAPVTLTTFTARHKGSGVAIDWSTSQELNNSYFQVERSADGNTNWSVIASVVGAGNSQVVNNYNSYDASPLSGVNYYRLKQVDYDGKSTYSNTVAVKMDLQKTAISVLANPFYNTLSVNFVSLTSQTVTARLVDITGKQVAVEKWSVFNGTTKKDFTNVSGLQRGMYILSIINNTGEILFNGKVVKQ